MTGKELRQIGRARISKARFSLPLESRLGYTSTAPWWWWKVQPSDAFLTEATIMIIVGILASIVAIGFFCCLLFYLAVYALPLFAGVTAGVWAYGTGAGWLGGIAVGVVASLATLLVGHLLLTFVKPLWLRLMIA